MRRECQLFPLNVLLDVGLITNWYMRGAGV